MGGDDSIREVAHPHCCGRLVPTCRHPLPRNLLFAITAAVMSHWTKFGSNRVMRTSLVWIQPHILYGVRVRLRLRL
jgi:hypothetical protein